MPATNTASADPMFFVTVIPSNEGDRETVNDWFVQATEADLCRTFESARDLASDLNATIILRDAAGFRRGQIEANGDYRMS